MRVFQNIKGLQLIKKKPLNVLPFQIAVGQIMDKVDENTREVKVIKMGMNEYLKMYFNKSYVFKSVDTDCDSQKGDIVLLKKLDKPPTQTKLFQVEKILFKINNLIDPITGKSVNYDQEEIKKHIENIAKSLNKI